MSLTLVNHDQFSLEIDTESDTCPYRSSTRQSIQLSSNGKHNAQPGTEFRMELHTVHTAPSPWQLQCARVCAVTDSISAGGDTERHTKMTDNTENNQLNNSGEFAHISKPKSTLNRPEKVTEPTKMSARYRFVQGRCQQFEDDLAQRPICSARIHSTNESILECCVMPADTVQQKLAQQLHMCTMNAQIIEVLLGCCAQCKSSKQFEPELVEDIQERGMELSLKPHLWEILGSSNSQQKPQPDLDQPLGQVSLPIPIPTIEHAILNGTILEATPACREHSASWTQDTTEAAVNQAATRQQPMTRPTSKQDTVPTSLEDLLTEDDEYEYFTVSATQNTENQASEPIPIVTVPSVLPSSTTAVCTKQRTQEPQASAPNFPSGSQ